METIYRDYAPRGVKFYYVYKSLAHPETNGYVQPFTLKERLMHVQQAKRRLGSEFTWLCDSMSNEFKHALGDAPNSEYVVDPEGKVVRKRSWSNAAQLRKDLEELVGPVDKPTQVADLKLKTIPPPKVAAKGVVKRIDRPRNMRPLKIEPLIAENGKPFYAKLRAEGDSQLQRAGKGKMYLRFHMDPLYGVHWNNLTKPIRVELQMADAATVTPASLVGPKPKEPSDIDPREFLVDVDAAGSKEPIQLTVHYFACNDEQGWCVPVSQTYAIHFEADPDGGRVTQGRGSGRGRPRPGAGPFRPGNGRGPFVFGRLVAVDVKSRALTIRVRGGDQKKFKVHENAQIVRDRRRSSLKDFKPGDMIRARFEPAEKGLPIVRRMMGRSAR